MKELRETLEGAAKRVLVTGAGGYIGSVLVDLLLQLGYEVVALDRFFFGEEVLARLRRQVHAQDRLVLRRADIRFIDESEFEGVYAVIDLAALSNDPAADIDPELTRAINHRGRVRVATLAKSAGVSRYVLSSSCSVYGSGESLNLTEEATVNPLTTYAKSNYMAEGETMDLADDEFCVSAMRNATVFGLSDRMRFDLVINLMTLHAFENSRVTVMGGGRQWRPMVHVTDVARAFLSILEAPRSKVNQQVFNVGLANYQVRSLAYTVRESLPFPIEVIIAPDDIDKRDYSVSFEKAKSVLGFVAQRSIHQGIGEIYEALKMGDTESSMRTNTVAWYKNLLRSKALLDSIELDGKIF